MILKHLCILCIFISSSIFAQESTLFLEDWDTTPQIPNELRGWQEVSTGTGNLLLGIDSGFYLQSRVFDTALLFLGTSNSSDFATWLTNDYIGQKNYRNLNVQKIMLDVRHDSVPSSIQNDSTNISILFAAAELVNDPNDPGNPVIPFIWTLSEEVIVRDEGWRTFAFDIPSDAISPPDGWFVYPESDENWNLVMSQIDDIRICFCPFQPDLGGVPFTWDVGLDNFTVITGNPTNAVPVPSLSLGGIYLMILLVGLLGVGFFFRNRAKSTA